MAKKSAISNDTSNSTPEPVTTQRAYTLRLRGVDPQDSSWRDALWATHEAINSGTKVFGDWLLTLRGGLSHELAEPPPAKGKKRSNDETAAIRKNRRILLALSWLSVEDERGAPSNLTRVTTGKDADATRREKTVAALRAILAARQVGKQEIESWVADCADSLSSRIRDDAVWINRRAAFESQADKLKGLTQEYAYNTIMSFFGPDADYFKLPDLKGDEEAGFGAAEEGPEFRTLARQWASTNFGTGEKSDTRVITTNLSKLANADLGRLAGSDKGKLIAELSKRLGGPTADIDGLRIAIGWKTGRSSKGRLAIDSLPDRLTKTSIQAMQQKFREEADAKESSKGLRQVPKWMALLRQSIESASGMPFKKGDDRDHIGEFSVMLDHAARRVSIGHSWIKRAEAQRRKFEEDAKRLGDVPNNAAAWLDSFIAERSGSSGATAAGGEYRIRRRAIEGWDEVVKRWKRATCKTEEDRIAAAREVQADPEIDKFGDIQLFEALAADDAECVWRQNGKATADPLRDYVLGHDARFKQRRFKVPAYRHPDPLRHPVFGDFGNSRWSIEYAVHEAAKSTGGKRTRDAGRAAWLQDRCGLRMGLWDGDAVHDVSLRWSSKRLIKDLSLDSQDQTKPVHDVGRADRLGRAASGIKPDERPIAAGLFELADWNGRLQAPRAQLDAIASCIDKNGGKWNDKARTLRNHLSWLVTFSAKLECRGPFVDYAQGFDDNAPAKPFISRRGELAVKHESNEKRQGHAKLILSRLPGLRVLSVDLGHRFAASCAVWETLSLAALKGEIKDWTIVSGGTGEQHLYLHARQTDPKSKKERTTIYRRIGSDKLPDGKDHPAPWARLDRQFLIKLQGEERPARAASSKPEHGINEAALIASMAQELGQLRDDAVESTGRGVDELMRRAVRIAMLGLKRHGRMAKIAYAFKPDCPGIPGMGGALKSIKRGDDEHIKFLTNALADWHALATHTEWDGSAARKLWNEHVKPLQSGFELSEPTPPDPNAERPTRQQRRKSEDDLREKLKPIAEHFAKAEPEVASAIHNEWSKLWADNDGIERKSDSDPVKSDFVHTLIRDGNGKVIGSRTAPRKGKEVAGGWHSRLRLLTDWIMGWHLPGAQSKHWNRNVGGLSLTRIATMRSLYQLHKAFDMRPRPEKIQGAPRFGESNTGIAQSILDAMERMREQRVKQIASRIAASALGLGGRWKEVERRDRKGKPLLGEDGKPRMKRVWVEEPSPKYPTCHAVVIENLRNYRPDELQTRRENKALMSWSAGKVRKYLEEACQLHGLHLREVMPNYTSRQCSRTGLPGMRCADVPINDFLNSRYWAKVVASARKRLADKGTDSLDTMIRDLHDLWSKAPDDAKKKQCTLRIPKPGADLFVAALTDKQLANHDRMCKSQDCPTCTILSRATQADLNAAANIGLRALLDPDFTGKWWYILCESATGKPAKEKCAGAACLEHDREYLAPQGSKLDDGSAKKKSKSGERTNAWRDLDSSGDWLVHGAYWNLVKARIVKQLRAANGLESADSHS